MSWPLVKLGTLVAIKTGRLDANAADEKGLYPFFTCSRDPLKINTYAFDCDAILIAGNGDLNVKHYSGKFNAYQRTYVVTSLSDEVLDTRYLFYFMDKYVERLRELSIGGVIKYIKLGMLTDAEIPLPPLPEQKRIATVLDKADAIRRKRQQAIQLADEFLRAVFLDMFGDPVTNPKGWAIHKMSDVIDFKGGSQPPKETFEYEEKEGYIRLVQIRDFRTDKFKTYIPESLAKRRFESDDVMIGRYGPPVFQILRGLSGSYNVALMKAAPKEGVTKDFVYRLLQLPAYQDAVISNSERTAGQTGVNLDLLNNLDVPLPPLDIQISMSEQVGKVEKLANKLKLDLHNAESLFSSLSQKAFRGEL